MCFSENPDMIHTETETHMHFRPHAKLQLYQFGRRPRHGRIPTENDEDDDVVDDLLRRFFDRFCAAVQYCNILLIIIHDVRLDLELLSVLVCECRGYGGDEGNADYIHDKNTAAVASSRMNYDSLWNIIKKDSKTANRIVIASLFEMSINYRFSAFSVRFFPWFVFFRLPSKGEYSQHVWLSLGIWIIPL